LLFSVTVDDLIGDGAVESDPASFRIGEVFSRGSGVSARVGCTGNKSETIAQECTFMIVERTVR